MRQGARQTCTQAFHGHAAVARAYAIFASAINVVTQFCVTRAGIILSQRFAAACVKSNSRRLYILVFREDGLWFAQAMVGRVRWLVWSPLVQPLRANRPNSCSVLFAVLSHTFFVASQHATPWNRLLRWANNNTIKNVFELATWPLTRVTEQRWCSTP